MEQKAVNDLSCLKKSLKLNIKILSLLEEEKAKYENLLSLNKEKQANLMRIVKEEELRQKISDRIRYNRSAKVFAAPYFQDAVGMVPPPNEDTIKKKKSCDLFAACLTRPRPWSPKECQMLQLGVTKYTVSSALQHLQTERNCIKKKLKSSNVLDEEREGLEDDLYIVEQKIRHVNNKHVSELWRHLKGDINWLVVSATHMKGTRTPEECESMWKNCLSFDINNGEFSKREDDKLGDLALDSNERNWDAIAAALKTNRNAIQCFTRYQTKLKGKITKKFWTKEEDDHLIALIEKHRNYVMPWSKISTLMGNRTSTQIKHRCYRAVKRRGTCSGPFSPEEDALLIALHQKFEGKWYLIKNYFQRRNAEQIIERFNNVLRPNKKSGPWSQEEDKLLINMIRKHGYGKWTKISQKIFGRSDNQCSQRAKRLLNWSVDLHSERGTGEYDTNVYNPELFASILRLPPKQRYLQHHRIAFSKIKPDRENALKRLLNSLEIIVPEYSANIEDVNSIDVSWMSPDLLMKLSDELQADLPKIENHEKDKFIPPVRYLTNRPPKRRTVESESDESDEENYSQVPQEEEIPEEEIDLVNSSLHAMFEMQANIKPHRMRKTQEIGIAQWAEMSLYAKYLYKQFHCKTSCDTEDEEVVFQEVDYEESIQNITNHLIQPPVYGNQFIVLVPNLTTMAGMESVETTENRLISMSGCVCHSKLYTDYLCERRKFCPQCLQCLQKSGETDCSTTPKAVISDMKKKSFLLDSTLENSAYLEGASVERLTNSCVCKALADSKESVQILRKRFMSLFMWPALLSVTEFNKEQESMISSKERENPDYFSDTIEVQRSKESCQKRKRQARLEQVTKKRKLTVTDSLLEPSQESGYSSLHE